MKYNPNNPIDRQRATERFNKLIEGKELFEIKGIKPIRSNQQNRYLHLLINWYAFEYGDLPEFVKQVTFKKTINPDIFRTEFTNKKTGEVREDWRSTRDLDTREMTKAIDRFRDYAGQGGIYLPEANETEYLQWVEAELSKRI